MTEIVRDMKFTLYVDTNTQTHTFEGSDWDALRRAWTELAEKGLALPLVGGGQDAPGREDELRVAVEAVIHELDHGEMRPLGDIKWCADTLRAALRPSVEAPAAPEGAGKPVADALHGALCHALQNAWNDYCSDSGCHPDVFAIRGRELTANFMRGDAFTHGVVDWLAPALRTLYRTPAGAPAAEDVPAPLTLNGFALMCGRGREVLVESFADDAPGVPEWHTLTLSFSPGHAWTGAHLRTLARFLDVTPSPRRAQPIPGAAAGEVSDDA